MGTELTYKQRRFVAYYLGECNGNATDAARKAGYAGGDSSLRAWACRLQQNTAIRAAIDAKLASVAMPADEILARMSDTAGADLADFIKINKSGNCDPDLRKAKRLGKLHVAKKIKFTVRGVELELRDSHAAQVKLGEYHGLWAGESKSANDLESAREKLRQNRANAANAPHREPEPGE